MVVTIMTGKRPELLDKTLESLFGVFPYLYNETLMALANGGDEPTQDVLRKYEVPYFHTKELLPIGQSISLLAQYAQQAGDKYWLIMEDDWLATDSDTVTKAVDIMDANPDITQIRLRHISETVLTRNMVTNEPITWQVHDGYRTAKAHLTFNPSIIRTKDIPKAFPCTGERHAQKNWHSNGMWLVAQLTPGIWKHIGQDNSLRLQTNSEV